MLFIFRVELALWTHFVAVQLQPDLLDLIPTSNNIISGSTELETTTPVGNEDEDTMKTTTSDDAEITADENSTDLVSSSKDDDETTTDRELNLSEKDPCVNGNYFIQFIFNIHLENMTKGSITNLTCSI